MIQSTSLFLWADSANGLKWPLASGHWAKAASYDGSSAMVSGSANPPRFDILGIGNAIVDVVAPVPDSFLSRHDMHKGAMALIDAETADRLYAAMPPAQESSGGSAANTCAVAAALGARVAYLGRVADDALGAAFRHDIGAIGVHFPTPSLTGGAPTARCLVLVTPDGQR